MKLAAFAIGVLASAFIFQLVLWRVRPPRLHTATLLLIFIGVLIVALSGGIFCPVFSTWAPQYMWQFALIATFHVSLSLAYIAFYSAIEGDSPSCQIVKFVAASGNDGCRREEFVAVIDDQSVIISRISAMANGKLIIEDNGMLKLTGRGRILARIYFLVERVFGLPRGG